jgi:hypothetical protein
MYGLVNKALEEMVISRHGEETWERIKKAAGVGVEVFISNEGYPDEVTYKLVGEVSDQLKVPAPQLLEEFGIHWVLKTAVEGYGDLMEAGGKTLGEFLQRLPTFHTNVALIFPHLNPPQFRCSDVDEHSLKLHYYSEREGLAPFVIGLLKGLTEHFRTPARIEHVTVREGDDDHDVFLIDWSGAPA